MRLTTRTGLAAALALGLIVPAALRGQGGGPPGEDLGGRPPGPPPGMACGRGGPGGEMMPPPPDPREVFARYPEAREAHKRNVEAEMEVRRLSGRYRDAEGAKREELKKSLGRALAEQFDARAFGAEVHAKLLREEAARVERRFAKRRERKTELVEKRLAELTAEEEGWE